MFFIDLFIFHQCHNKFDELLNYLWSINYDKWNLSWGYSNLMSTNENINIIISNLLKYFYKEISKIIEE